MANAPPRDRQVTSVPYPEVSILTEKDLFDASTGLPSISRLRKHLEQEGRLDARCALRLVELAREIFRREPNMVVVERPVTIVLMFMDNSTIF